MIRAEKAERILKRYESDYDNFLDKLKVKAKASDKVASRTKSVRDKQKAKKAKRNLSEAKQHKKVHLGEKAKDLIDKAGGIEGASESVNNVIKYIKDNKPSDYQVNVGGDKEKEDTKKQDEKSEDTILGMPSTVVYVGGSILVIGIVIGAVKLLKPKQSPPVLTQQAPTLHPSY